MFKYLPEKSTALTQEVVLGSVTRKLTLDLCPGLAGLSGYPDALEGNVHQLLQSPVGGACHLIGC